jgi:pimeloyl-ACP methyl ester carboxylesterase
MQGELLTYLPKKRLVAFLSVKSSNPSVFLVFVGGLSDGLLCVPYLESLAAALHCSFAQPLLSSSYRGYGRCSIEQDVEELETFIRYLRAERGATKVYVMGHSTGGNDAVHLSNQLVDGIILQGPVSDRLFYYEGLFKYAPGQLQELIQLARSKESHELMPSSLDEYAAISAGRFLSLTGRATLDDVFSIDLTREELDKYWAKATRCPNVLVLLCANDEYCTRDVNEIISFFRQWTDRIVVLPEADHAVTSIAAQETLIRAVADYINE